LSFSVLHITSSCSYYHRSVTAVVAHY